MINPTSHKVDFRYYLNVPFEEKDKAKDLKCIWDIERKQWYVTESNPNYSTVFREWFKFY
jgi:hypothetical protein